MNTCLKNSTKFNVNKFELSEMMNTLSKITSKNSRDSFLLSAIYYRLTGRKGARVYSNENSFVTVIEHPHLSNSLMIFPEICDGSDFSLTAEVIQDINHSENEIYFCRYTDMDFVKLNAQLTNNLAIEKIIEENLDWKYPLRILDTQIVSDLKGGRFQKIRNTYLRVGEYVDIVPVEGEKHLSLMNSVLKLWEKRLISIGKETEDMFGFYNELFSLFQKGVEVSGLCFVQKGRPIGFTIWDVCCNDIANLFVNLADPTIVGASDFQLVNTCRCLQKQGIQLLNTGGSETDGLDFFKNKYRPTISHEVFTYKLMNK